MCKYLGHLPCNAQTQPKLVLELHAALRRTGLGGKLPYKSLVAFLRCAKERITKYQPQNRDV
jgi:hypothetical protein